VVRFDAHEAFRGGAQVSSVRERAGSTVVGLSFEDFLLDVEDLLQLRSVQAWVPEGAGARLGDAAWHVPDGDRFKSLVAELRLYLEDAQQRLTALQAALISRLRVEFVAEAVRISEEADAALRTLPGEHANAAAKEWSLRHVHEFLMQAPILHRARHKPFGYPGDYEVMNFIYTRNFEGATLFGRAVSLAFTQTCAARAVRYRKDLVVRHLKALLQRRAGSREPVRVLSIATGPAQELVELFAEMEEMPAPLEIVLFEQDKNALAQAWRSLTPRVEERFPRTVRLTFLHDSVKRLLRDANLFQPFGTFDLVYSCGLFDYFAHRTAVVLARHLATTVRPGGQLLVANMVDHPTRWIMEHHLDWPLVYRTREELLELARRAVPGAQLRILEEESGANPFVELVPG
jgi:SAM-dependent methyltransferase